jgi:hypothetical protein
VFYDTKTPCHSLNEGSCSPIKKTGDVFYDTKIARNSSIQRSGAPHLCPPHTTTTAHSTTQLNNTVLLSSSTCCCHHQLAAHRLLFFHRALQLGGLLRRCHRRLSAPPPSSSVDCYVVVIVDCRVRPRRCHRRLAAPRICRCQSTGWLIVTSGVYSLIGINVGRCYVAKLSGLLRCCHRLDGPRAWWIVTSLSSSIGCSTVDCYVVVNVGRLFFDRRLDLG